MNTEKLNNLLIGLLILGIYLINGGFMIYSNAQAGLWPGKPLTEKELRELEEKGNKGDKEALACLFDYYIYEDYDRALFWARIGDKFNDARSRYLLGGILVDSNNPNEQKEGVALLKKAAEQNYWLAQTVLARLYKDGKVVQKDFRETEKWFRKAALQGVRHSMLALCELMTNRAKDISTLSEAYGWTFLMLKRTTSKWSKPFIDEVHEAQHKIIKKAKELKIDEKNVISCAESWAKKKDPAIPMTEPFEPRCKYWNK